MLLCRPGWLPWCVFFLTAVRFGFLEEMPSLYYDLDYPANSEDSDESCEPGHYMCLDGACIPHSWVCDGNDDCLGGDDEHRRDCEVSCLPEQFRCEDGACLAKEFRCDGKVDCTNAEDEENCNKTRPCTANEVSCDNLLECVPISSLCNGEPDCADNSDETNCQAYTCAPGEFKCGNTTECIPNSWRCDGINNCYDRSDEICSDEILKCDTFLCEDKSTCLDYRAVCDGNTDCPDGSDEAENCSIACRQKRCSYSCKPSAGGVSCTCPKGFAPHPEKSTLCQDIDECYRPKSKDRTIPACSQVCTNTKGSYYCQCVGPYTLEPDRRTCRMRHPDPMLLLSGPNNILKYNLRKRGHTLETVQNGTNFVIDMDVDCGSRRLFWIDYSDSKIYYVELTWENTLLDKPVYVNVGLTNPQALSYNWHAELLYILDSFHGVIVACTVEGLACAEVVDGLKDRLPGDLLVDPLSRSIFWVENQHPPAIMRSDLDGRNKEIFLDTDVTSMSQLVIDYPTRQLYWVDTGKEMVLQLPLDAPASKRPQSVRIFTKVKVFHPTALAVVEDWLIWAEMKNGIVMKVNKWTGGDRRRILKHDEFVTRAIAMHPALQPDAGDNACWDAGCSQMCVESRNEKGFRCLCPPEMVLHSDGVTCKWVRSTPFILMASDDKIFQVPTINIGHVNVRQLLSPALQGLRIIAANPVTQEILIGARRPDGRPVLMKTSSIWSSLFSVKVIEQRADVLGEPLSLAVDWAADQVFWLNGQRNTIEIFKTVGKSHTSLKLQDVNVRSITISIDLGFLFYSTWGVDAKIVQCRMDGTNCTTLVSNHVRKPDGLQLQRGKVYWIDLYFSSVSSVAYKTGETNTEMLKRNIQDFTVYKNLYYHDNSTKSVHLYDMEESADVTEYNFDSMDLRDLIVMVPRQRDLDFPCARNNGGCTDICVSMPEHWYRCLCPLGKVLASDYETCQFAEVVCSPHEVLCKSSDTCISKSDLCLERVMCHELAAPIECMHNEIEEEGAEHCPEYNHCQQFCTMTERGPSCSCDHGFQLGADGRSCTDMDECSERNGYCSQLCQNKRGSYSCGCVQDYTLISDKISCFSSDHNTAYLIVTTSVGFMVVEMDGEREYPVLLRLFPPMSFDVTLDSDWETYRTLLQSQIRKRNLSFMSNFIWSEPPGTFIQKFSGSFSQVLSVMEKVVCVRVDQVTKNVYFLTELLTHHNVIVCDNGMYKCVTILTGDDWLPSNLVLYPAKRTMYWTDQNLHTLNTAYMDGEGKREISKDVHAIQDRLALCTIRERFYWIEYSSVGVVSTIHTMKLDGSDRYTLGIFPQRILYSMDIFEGFLYMTDQKAQSVFKISTFSSRPVLSEMRHMRSAVHQLRVVHSSPGISNPCDTLQCSDLCLLGETGAKCVCPQRVLLSSSANGCAARNGVTRKPSTSRPPTPQPYPPQTPGQLPITAGPRPRPTTTAVESRLQTRSPYEVCSYFCLNGAFCKFVNGKPICTCSFGFSGTRCEQAVPTKSTGPPDEDVVIDTFNTTEGSGAVGVPLSNGLKAGGIVGIVLAFVAVVFIVVVVVVYYRKKRAERHDYAGVEFKMESDEAFLVPGGSGGEGSSSYFKWDLEDNAANNRSSGSFGTGVFSNPIPIFNPTYSPLPSDD